jgi:PAS domain S-box-containing protein
MSLRFRIVTLILVSFTFLVGIGYLLQRFILLPSYIELEQHQAKEDVGRCLEAIKSELHHLELLADDWAAWNDTYRFIQDRNEEYIESNLVVETFTGNRLNLLYICKLDGKVVWGEIRDLETGQTVSLEEFPKAALTESHILLSHKNVQNSIGGLMMTAKGPILLASRPIVNSDYKGPIRGAFIMGRFLNKTLIKKLREQTRVDFQIYPITKDSISADSAGTPKNIHLNQPDYTLKESADTLQISTVLMDIQKSPVIRIEAIIPKDISNKGIEAINSVVTSIIVSGLFITFVLILYLQKHVIAPIKELTNYAEGIRRSGDLQNSLVTKRSDEIGRLSEEFGHMAGRLKAFYADLEKKVEERTVKLSEANAALKKEIADRLQTEQALRDSEEKYRDLIESADELVQSIDPDGKILQVNQKWMKTLGYKDEEIQKLTIWNIIHPDAIPHCKEIFKKICSGEKVNEIETLFVTKNGESIAVEGNTSCRFENGKPVLTRGIFRDISERKRAEKEKELLETKLQRFEKMEALGSMAGGVAHDLNNILSGIVSYPDLLLMDLPANSPLKEPLITIKRSGEKATAVVQDLLTLARRGLATSDVVNLNLLVTDYLVSNEFAQLQKYHHQVKIETDLELNLLNIMGSPVHLSKTIMNLVSNAAEAMPDGGNISIETRNQYVDMAINGYDEVKEGDYVTLSISDTGVGISPNDQKRIFEPYFTKKVMGRSGSGLGMAVVWGTVRDHKGYILIKSSEDRGTTIDLYFPVTRQEMRERLNAPLENLMGNGEKILVVDDVKEQREIACRMLDKLNYEVESVSSGEEAIEYIKKKSADLLILDMIIDPGIDGCETYKRILQINSNQKAIIASGYAETDRVKEAQKLGAGQYIKKPYILETIGIAIKNEISSEF